MKCDWCKIKWKKPIDLFVTPAENEMNRQNHVAVLRLIRDQLIILFIFLSNVNSFILITRQITHTLSVTFSVSLSVAGSRLSFLSHVVCATRLKQPAGCLRAKYDSFYFDLQSRNNYEMPTFLPLNVKNVITQLFRCIFSKQVRHCSTEIDRKNEIILSFEQHGNKLIEQLCIWLLPVDRRSTQRIHGWA